MNVSRSASGLATLTEHGGGATNTGQSQLIVGPNGEALKPIFVAKGTCGGDHAIFAVRPGMHVVSGGYSRVGEYVHVQRIYSIEADNEVVLTDVGKYENGDSNLSRDFDEAVKAALEKSKCYHCRCVHFATK